VLKINLGPVNLVQFDSINRNFTKSSIIPLTVIPISGTHCAIIYAKFLNRWRLVSFNDRMTTAAVPTTTVRTATLRARRFTLRRRHFVVSTSQPTWILLRRTGSCRELTDMFLPVLIRFDFSSLTSDHIVHWC
jgi:hypothetical protein